ncbi:hypothetical protein ASF36_23420 [Methylobacterium sp. Leaf90]|nr:hypothetical protein ASF36_23420 [Methylobacterium sp. Leaf90]
MPHTTMTPCALTPAPERGPRCAAGGQGEHAEAAAVPLGGVPGLAVQVHGLVVGQAPGRGQDGVGPAIPVDAGHLPRRHGMDGQVGAGHGGGAHHALPF